MSTPSPDFAPRIVDLKWDRLYGDMIRRQIWDVWPDASVHVFQSGFDALSSIQEKTPDLFIAGAKIHDMDGLEHLEPYVDSDLPILIVTSQKDEQTFNLLRTIRYDGLLDGFAEGLDVLPSVLRQVIQRRIYISSSFRDHLKPVRNITLDALTPTQRVVLSVIGDGSTDDEASERLGIAPGTVNQHWKAIMAKLKLHHKGQLMLYALQQGYVRVTTDNIYYPGFQRRLQGRKTGEPEVVGKVAAAGGR
ncbi:MAG TPA: response regulator transcription factor [Opitutaceae bacterium]